MRILHNRTIELDDGDSIQVVAATSPKDANAIAIHLFHPDQYAFDDAVEQACRDGFKLIVLHNKASWPFTRSEYL